MISEPIPSDVATLVDDESDGAGENPLIDREDKGEEGAPKPWDPKHIRITTKNFTIREINSQIIEGELDLAPDFQRSYVWKNRQQIRLIESILLGIPLPAFYFNQDSSGSHQVIDGVQRLTTVKKFIADELALDSDHLEYLGALEGTLFSTLDPAVRRRFAGTQIVAHVIEPQTPDEVKYDIFNRVNTGGSPLTPQEIRHCMSKSRSRRFLAHLADRETFDIATQWVFWRKDSDGQLIRDNQRMTNREMALRFCAFRTVPVEEYANFSSLDAFLLDFTRRIDEDRKIDLIELETAFERAMSNAVAVLGTGAFRRWPPDASRRGPLNRAIFESQALALADHPLEAVTSVKEKIAEALRSLFNDQEYDNSVRQGTGDYRKVERRLSEAREAVLRIIK